jgi:hypothetical protein
MPRWGNNHKKALAKLFDSALADPESTKAADIDPIYSLDPAFKDVTPERFRDNYKKCATDYMAGKALDGIRRGESNWLIVFMFANSFLILFVLFCFVFFS